MRAIWTGCLGLSLAWGGTQASASDFGASRSGAAAPPAALGKPIATLGRPVASSPQTLPPRQALVDQEIRPVSLNVLGRPRVVGAAQQPSDQLPAPRPVTGEPNVWGIPQPGPSGQPVIVNGPPEDGGALDRPWGPGSCFSCWPFGCVDLPPTQCWISGEYLLWWMKGSNVPPLVTTSPAGTPLAQAGVLGAPGTGVLFGDEKVHHHERSGGRFTVGWWWDECHDCGLETNFFFLGQRGLHFLASSSGEPILARPFVDAATGRETSELIAFPGRIAGTARIDLPSRLWGIDSNLRFNWCRGQCWSLDKIIGFRYLDLRESLDIAEFLSVPGAPGQPPSAIIVNDHFGTRNQFYGGQVGLLYEVRKGRWYCDLLGKVALGGTHQEVTIDGSTTFIPAGSPAIVQPGGLLAQRSNIGHYSRSQFSVVPEIGFKLGYQLMPRLRMFVGYNFLYWNNVVRPGDQIDRMVNTSQIPSIFGPGQLVGPARPSFTFRQTDFWTHGVSFGLEWRF